MPEDLQLGKRLRRLRMQRGISQLELEYEVGFCPGIVSRIENGKVNPSKESLYKIATGLRLNLSECVELFGLDEIMEVTRTNFSGKLQNLARVPRAKF